jgi:hypothetical protein
MTRDDIIDDLLRRRPVGPDHKPTECSLPNGLPCPRHVVEHTLVVAQFGYTSAELFDLGFKTRKDVREFLRFREFDGIPDWHLGKRKRTLTRRTNLLWERIGKAVDRVIRRGGEGIYAVTPGYHLDIIGHLYARSKEEALENAKLFFGYLVPQPVRVKFTKRGPIQHLAVLNEQIAQKMHQDIKTAREKIEAKKVQIISLEAQLNTLKIVEIQQTAVETMSSISAMEDD